MDARDEYIKDFYGRILGIIRNESNGDKTVIDFPSRKILGWYKKQFDYTTDFAGRVIAKGDAAVSLIYKNKM